MIATLTEAPWWHRARCRADDVDRDLWVTGGAKASARARHVCLYHCPVLVECAEDAGRAPTVLRHSVVLGGVVYGHSGQPGAWQPYTATCGLCSGKAVRRG